MASLLDKHFRYTNAAESSKPGYLLRKFRKIEAELREKAETEKAKPVATVRAIKREAK